MFVESSQIMKKAKFLLLICLVLIMSTLSVAQDKPVSQKMASTAMTAIWAKSEAGLPARWSYEFGVVLKGVEGVWLSTGEGRYFSFIQKGMDNFVNTFRNR